MRSKKPISKYDCDEMDAHTGAYVDFVLETIAQIKLTCSDPLVLIEQRLEFFQVCTGWFRNRRLRYYRRWYTPCY